MAPFEPLESAPERILTLKVTLLLALTSLKRIGDLQALSVSEMCMDFAPGLVKVTLRPHAISQWIGMILWGLQTSVTQEAFPKHESFPSVSFPIQRTKVTRVTWDVFSSLFFSCTYITPCHRALVHSSFWTPLRSFTGLRLRDCTTECNVKW